MAKAAAPLEQIGPDRIRRNPDNPRLIFREEEMNELLESIREGGIRVPLSVYPEGGGFTLIDGERRWRCAQKLNLPVLPAIVIPKPTRLENLLMMFNIHNVRLDWDLMPMALKLGEVREMLEKERKETNAKALSAVTGVRLPTVRRALDLLDLPKKYQTLLLKEAAKPREEQRIKPDLFIEVYKSLHAVERHGPHVLDAVSKPAYVDAMVGKYVAGVVDNVVAYRDVSKIARADLAGADKKRAESTLVRLVNEPTYGVREAYEDTVKGAYDQRDLLTRIRALRTRLREVKRGSDLEPGLREALSELKREIARLVP